MKRLYIALICTFAVLVSASAKTYENVDTKYYKNSVYSVLINHTEQKFASEIRSQFVNIPTPDLYYDHGLNVKVITVDNKKHNIESINRFIDNNHIASRMVAKWFDRDILTGECNADLVRNRGMFEASELDREMAAHSARAQAMLADVGEELIGHTFLLVNEIHYIDHGQNAKTASTALKIFGAIAGAVVGGSVGDLIDNAGTTIGNMVETIKGFKVKITTYLYQLQWDDETANTFYSMHYSDVPDEEKRLAFERDRNKYRLKYVGVVESSGNTTSFLGIGEDQPLVMVRKACQRAIDENVADLQKKHDAFKAKSPVVEVDGKNIMACIGKKEGIDVNSRYEVLEAQEKDGRIQYRRVAVVRPVESRIWDNRYMAVEEQAYGADLGATTFIKESGGDIMPGHLLRQIK